MWGLEPLRREGPYDGGEDGDEVSVAAVERSERVEREGGFGRKKKKR